MRRPPPCATSSAVTSPGSDMQAVRDGGAVLPAAAALAVEGTAASEAARPLAGASETPRARALRAALKVTLFALGVTAVVLLVRSVGARAVLDAVAGAGVWLPAIVALEIGFVAMDVLALRSLAGARSDAVPASTWLRSAMVAYGFMILLPAGRAGGEIARAAALGPCVGGARAAAMATRLQAVTLLANSLISLPCWAAVALASHVLEPLAWLVLGNGAVTAVLGGAIVLASRRSGVGGWLGQRIAALASHGARFDEALRDETPWAPAIAWCTAGRALQALQYGIILLAVGGTLTVTSAFVSQGIHLVGAGLGDMVPNQVGITEGAYRLFAAPLGLEDAPARAIGIALVARICQTALASAALAGSALLRSEAPAADPT